MRRLLLLAVLIGCATQPPAPIDEEPALPHHRRWSDRVGQGGQPVGEAGFARLRALGYTTVLSVDGALPDVTSAKRHGLRTLHVPLPYQGISDEAAAQIVKAVHTAEGTVYIHCHHGQHRCSAATAVARIGVEGVANAQALEDMKTSGCSPKYAGLYRAVEQFEAPSPEALAAVPQPPERVEPEGIRARMVAISRTWERLDACRQAGWTAPTESPDLDPAHEALMLEEGFRELSRSEDAERLGVELMALLGRSEAAAAALQDALRNDDGAAVEAAFQRSRRSCAACHESFRD